MSDEKISKVENIIYRDRVNEFKVLNKMHLGERWSLKTKSRITNEMTEQMDYVKKTCKICIIY